MSFSSDFKSPAERRASGCYKWDSALPSGVDLTPAQRENVIPLWVADMDFPAAPCIRRAIEKRAAHGVFGYVKVQDSFYDAVIKWFGSRHGLCLEREWMLYTTGVVPAISAALKALARPGSGVIIQPPVYNCFYSSVRNAGLQIVESPLVRREMPDGRYTFSMDFEDLEAKCADPANTILLLCNPHNPAGRLWSADELRRAGEIAFRYGVIVISDEIHCEIVPAGAAYTPFASLGEQFMRGSVTLISPSKSFNFAGLKIANIVCHNSDWRNAIDKVINIYEICDVNPFGPVAVEAAYSDEGAAWLREMNDVVTCNYNILLEECSALAGFPVSLLEATYLPMIDVSCLDMTSDEVERELLRGEQVWVNAGTMYGRDGYVRINLACSPTLLRDGARRIAAGLKRLKNR